jgi:molybdopterin biosynthesis enzyme
VRRAGEDLRRRQPVAIRAGKLLRPAELGLIASLGIAEVCVRRRLRVAFFSTGDELASIGAPLKEGEVYDSNRYTLHGMLARLGCEIDRPRRGARRPGGARGRLPRGAAKPTPSSPAAASRSARPTSSAA